MKKVYNKLVRDNIPEIIKNDGKIAHFKKMDMEEYADKLLEKLHEEVNEFSSCFANQNDEEAVKELADVEEVIFAILNLIGVEQTSFEKIRDAKRTKNGGFEKRLLLESVEE